MRKLSELDGEKTALIDFHLQPLQDIFGNACVGEVWGTVLFCASSSCLYLPFPSSAIPSLHKIALPNISLTCWLDRLANPRSMPTRLFSSRQQVIFVCVLKPLLAYLVVSCIPHARAYAPRPTPKIRAAAYPFRFTRINYSARTKHIPGIYFLLCCPPDENIPLIFICYGRINAGPVTLVERKGILASWWDYWVSCAGSRGLDSLIDHNSKWSHHLGGLWIEETYDSRV